MHEQTVALQMGAVQRTQRNLSQGHDWERKGKRKGGKEKGQIKKENLEGKDQITALESNPLPGVLCSVLPRSSSVNPGHSVNT